MKLRVVSDLHFEFHAHAGRDLLASQVTGGDYDVLVVAGDLASSHVLAHSISILASKTKCPILFVTGNHEFYGSNRKIVLDICRALERIYPQLRFLDNAIAEIDGVRFLGSPLWFRKTDAPKWPMNDFTTIERFEEWVYTENFKALAFFKEELEPLDVVITHYLPTEKSIHSDYKGSLLNPFFLCDVTSLIVSRKPRLWIHGHTHRSCDYQVAETRVVCNPYGYAAHEENPAFDPTLTVEVES